SAFAFRRGPPSFPTRRSSDLGAEHPDPPLAARIELDVPLTIEPPSEVDLRVGGEAFGHYRNLPASISASSPANRRRSAHQPVRRDRKSTRLNSSHVKISYAVF